ncbi:hypothetical protein CSOJ01_14253 [Colletotrichum sojae]|uniref:Uncharacterized protein n=1 Tax=Colletotrichum sojae TaxID=2175907 RepID=A0A8H6MJJ4_9PEZI|nr:hypothetical protein CSOJ01_14253 [Colletotrichum sojae]
MGFKKFCSPSSQRRKSSAQPAETFDYYQVGAGWVGENTSAEDVALEYNGRPPTILLPRERLRWLYNSASLALITDIFFPRWEQTLHPGIDPTLDELSSRVLWAATGLRKDPEVLGLLTPWTDTGYAAPPLRIQIWMIDYESVVLGLADDDHQDRYRHHVILALASSSLNAIDRDQKVQVGLWP